MGVSLWEQRIAEAFTAGMFPEAVKRAAARWDVCAVAEFLLASERQWVAILPLRPDPIAQKWQELGLAFHRAVLADDPATAERLLMDMRQHATRPCPPAGREGP